MKKLCITFFLCILCIVSMVSVIALFISGPSIQYEKQIEEEKNIIKQQVTEEISTIERHVFRYITYVVTTDHDYIFFHSNGQELLRRQKQDIHLEEAIQKVSDEKKLINLKAKLGYAYEQGAYVVENDTYVILLDIDTLEEIYYRRK